MTTILFLVPFVIMMCIGLILIVIDDRKSRHGWLTEVGTAMTATGVIVAASVLIPI